MVVKKFKLHEMSSRKQCEKKKNKHSLRKAFSLHLFSFYAQHS